VKVRFSNRASAGRFSYPSIGESKPSVLERDPCWGKGKAGGLHRVTSRFYYFHQNSFFSFMDISQKSSFELVYSLSSLFNFSPFPFSPLFVYRQPGDRKIAFSADNVFFFRLPSGKVFSCFPPARRRRSVYRLAIHFRPLTPLISHLFSFLLFFFAFLFYPLFSTCEIKEYTKSIHAHISRSVNHL